METKICSICKIEKNFRDFIGKDGAGWKYKRICSACRRKSEARRRRYTKAWGQEHKYRPGSLQNYQVRKKWLKKQYGLSIAQYASMYIKQKGKCAICGEEDVKGKPLHVDHDHRSGKIRGLLCRNCNLALGYIRDNPVVLGKMLSYLVSDVAVDVRYEDSLSLHQAEKALSAQK